MSDPVANILEVDGLAVDFVTRRGRVNAVTRVDLAIPAATTVALVGESGSGKSVTAMALADLLGPTAETRYESFVFRGQAVREGTERDRASLRGHGLSYVFQDPMATFNPVFTIGTQVGEKIAGARTRSARREAVHEVLRAAGLKEPARVARSYPHQLSGGMLQRASIAMALTCRPSVLVADEPTTALDVTIQAQIMELLRGLQAREHMGIILITHNLALVSGNAALVHIMYAGLIVEQGPIRAVLSEPHHPYTRGLLNAIPRLAAARAPLVPVPGNVPRAGRFGEGCRFAPRCARARAECRRAAPPLEDAGENRKVRCLYWK